MFNYKLHRFPQLVKTTEGLVQHMIPDMKPGAENHPMEGQNRKNRGRTGPGSGQIPLKSFAKQSCFGCNQSCFQ